MDVPDEKALRDDTDKNNNEDRKKHRLVVQGGHSFVAGPNGLHETKLAAHGWRLWMGVAMC